MSQSPGRASEPDDPHAAERLDPRAIAESRKDEDSQFPRTLRTAFFEWYDQGDLEKLWEELCSIYCEPLINHYRRHAGSKDSFPTVPKLEPEEIVNQYFMDRVRREDFAEGSWYGKWLGWRQTHADNPARHLRHWIKTDFRLFCRDAAKSGWRRDERERVFADFEAAQIEADAPSIDTIDEFEEQKMELAGIAECAVEQVLGTYPADRRDKVSRLFRAIHVENRRYKDVAQSIGESPANARKIMQRFREAVRDESQRLLGALGYDDDDIMNILERL